MARKRWEDEDWMLSMPKLDEVVCRDCTFRKADQKAGDTVLHGALYGICDVFDSKPYPILHEGGECPYYVSDKDGIHPICV